MNGSELIRGHLETMMAVMSQMEASARFMSIYEYVLKNGRVWETTPLPSGVRRGIMKHCFLNSQKLARRCGFRYVEGYALGASPIPTLHAWCVGEDDLVIDCTPPWCEGEDNSYFGVEFSLDLVEEHTRGDEYTISMLDNWEKGWPLFRR